MPWQLRILQKWNNAVTHKIAPFIGVILRVTPKHHVLALYFEYVLNLDWFLVIRLFEVKWLYIFKNKIFSKILAMSEWKK